MKYELKNETQEGFGKSPLWVIYQIDGDVSIKHSRYEGTSAELEAMVALEELDKDN